MRVNIVWRNCAHDLVNPANPVNLFYPMAFAPMRATLLLLLFAGASFAQSPTLTCKRRAITALQPKPELTYPCDSEANDYDEKILKLPARRTSLDTLISELSSFTDAAWWTTDTVDLSVCDYTQKPGALTRDQRQSFRDGDYVFWLFGNSRARLVLIPDPCYQTQYGGSNAFLLVRSGGRVYVTQVLDGYFSRADNSVSVAFAQLNGEEIVEVATGSGGLNPSLTNYYFVIDPRTHRAIPKNIFRGEHGPRNQISSALLLSAAPAAEPLKVVRAHTLAPSFTIYVDDANGKIDDNGRTLSRRILRWNGKLYR